MAPAELLAALVLVAVSGNGLRGASALGASWTPISIGAGRNPLVVVCKLDVHTYQKDPSRMPMFKDLLRASGCYGSFGHGRSKSVPLSVVKAAVKDDPGVVQPSGFIFHESRCGSTLAANMLAANDEHLVFSEAAIINDLLGRGNAGIELLRTVVAQMGRMPGIKRLFFKISSAMVRGIPTFQLAFPSTPWIFIFRSPVEVMVSHIGNKMKRGKGLNPPCLRSRSYRDPKIVATLTEAHVSRSRWEERELWCAAHLATLCRSAISAADRRSSHGPKLARAVFIEYANLVPQMVNYVVPRHFRTPLSREDRARMLAVTQQYSKDRGGKRAWKSDTKAKVADASSKITAASKLLLQPVYAQLVRRVPRAPET